MRLFLRTVLFIINLCVLLGMPAQPSSARQRADAGAIPAGYVEITPDAFPEYLGAVGAEIFDEEHVWPLRLFLAEEELPFLQRGEFERLTRGAILSRIPKMPRDLPPGGKFPQVPQSAIVDIAAAIDTDQVLAWLQDPSLPKKNLGRFGPFAIGEDFFIYAYGSVRAEGVSWGLASDRPMAHAMIVLRLSDTDIFVLSLYRTFEQVEDLQVVIEEAVRYVSGGKWRALLAGAAPMATENRPFGVLLLAAETWQKQGKNEQAIAAFERIISVWSGEDQGERAAKMHALAGLVQLYRTEGRYAEAEQTLRDTIEKDAAGSASPRRNTLLLSYML